MASLLRVAMPYLIALLTGLAVGWWLTENHWQARYSEQQAEHAQTLGRIGDHAAEQLRQRQQEADELRQRQSAIDAEHHSELEKIRNENASTITDLERDNQRLSVRLATRPDRVPAAGAAACMDDGAGARADIHPEDAADIVRVTADADQCRAKLTGLQAWIAAQQEVTPE